MTPLLLALALFAAPVEPPPAFSCHLICDDQYDLCLDFCDHYLLGREPCQIDCETQALGCDLGCCLGI